MFLLDEMLANLCLITQICWLFYFYYEEPLVCFLCMCVVCLFVCLAWKLIWLLSISDSVINFCVLNVCTLIKFHYKQTNVNHNYKLLGLPTYYPFSNKLDVRQIKIKQPAILSWILHDRSPDYHYLIYSECHLFMSSFTQLLSIFPGLKDRVWGLIM